MASRSEPTAQEMAEAGLIYLGQNINILYNRGSGNETFKIHNKIPKTSVHRPV